MISIDVAYTKFIADVKSVVDSKCKEKLQARCNKLKNLTHQLDLQCTIGMKNIASLQMIGE